MKTKDEILKQQEAGAEEQRLENNVRKTEEAARQAFPNEKWTVASTLKLKNRGKGPEFVLPHGIARISVAQSRLTGLKDDERILVKEIRQGKILVDKGSFIYLLPKMRAPDGSFIKGPDAIVNGSLFEFKTITGSLDRVETRFRESREQGENVYLKIDQLTISKSDVVSKIRNVLMNKNYTGGTKGNMIVYLAQTERTYFFRIKDLK